MSICNSSIERPCKKPTAFKISPTDVNNKEAFGGVLRMLFGCVVDLLSLVSSGVLLASNSLTCLFNLFDRGCFLNVSRNIVCSVCRQCFFWFTVVFIVV